MDRTSHPCRSLASLLLIAGVTSTAGAATPTAASKPAPASAAPSLVVYRCTDAKGTVSLRDTPCARGQQQQARDMLRPQDPPPRPANVTATPMPVVISAPAPQVIVLQPPQPMFECIAPDGERYTSDTGLGRQRWEGVWLHMPNYPIAPPHSGPGRPRPADSGWIGYRDEHLRGRVELGGRHSPWRWPHGPVASGSWVRDPCHPLPPAEACDRLRDRRYQLDRRYNSALQSERAQITLDQRGIDARLANDCRGY